MFNTFTKAASGFAMCVGSFVLMTSTASASCGGLYCSNGGTPTLAPISSYGSSYGSTGYMSSVPATTSTYSGYSNTSYASGSQSGSSSYSSNTQIIPFSGVPQGLGANESLVPTNCPVNVYNPNGGDVVGCYSVVKTRPPVAVQNYVRVVRPVIYVRYPVPVQVPSCGMNSGYGYSQGGNVSRYGNGYGSAWSYGGGRSSCGG